MQSLEELAKYFGGDLKCKGSQERLVIHLVCPFNGFPIGSPVAGFQSLIVLSIDPEAIILASGDQAKKRTQFLWPSQVCIGVSVKISQILTVVSPLAEAKTLLSGLNATLRTASECPNFLYKTKESKQKLYLQENLIVL